MRAFFKRHLFLLSCAVVLMACSICEIQIRSIPRFDPQIGGTGVGYGAFTFTNYFTFDEGWFVYTQTHSPTIGDSFLIDTSGGWLRLEIPLWLPLSAVIGWLVVRELRFRETRAKAADCPRASAS